MATNQVDVYFFAKTAKIDFFKGGRSRGTVAFANLQKDGVMTVLNG